MKRFLFQSYILNLYKSKLKFVMIFIDFKKIIMILGKGRNFAFVYDEFDFEKAVRMYKKLQTFKILSVL